jgi:hypothetical protein
MLMQTTITIECGQDLGIKLTAHEEMLRCHSKRLDELYVRAKPVREQYQKCMSICDQLAALLFPEMTAKQFEETSSEDQVRMDLGG